LIQEDRAVAGTKEIAMKKVCILGIILLVVLYASGLWAQEEQADPGEKCQTCHQKGSPGLYNQWASSKHAENGVGCIDCHGAEEANPDVNAYIDKMLKIDPMHTWLSRPTAELKQEIRSGKIQEAYQELFKKK